MNKNIRMAVIAAAGTGKRCYPISTIFPKEMFPVHNKPVIHYLIEEAMALGAKKIIIVVSDLKSIIRKYVKMFFNELHIDFIVQNQPLGLLNLIHMLPLSKHASFYLMLGDELILYQKKTISKIKQALATSDNLVLIKKVNATMKSNYGMVAIANNQIIKYKEKPTQNAKQLTHAIIGRYFFDLTKMDLKPFKTKNDLVLLMRALIKAKKITIYDVKDARFDISTPKGLAEANHWELI